MLFLFFFLMIRRPPRSTLFPTRRSSDLILKNCCDALRKVEPGRLILVEAIVPQGSEPHMSKLTDMQMRSEEHTSELQSRSDLVCRLLLEKKKKKSVH